VQRLAPVGILYKRPVAAQKAFLDHLRIRHLVAVAGPSYGGYQAFQWAVVYPDFMDAIVPVNTAP
jgi:homoserine O-acetyltransferase